MELAGNIGWGNDNGKGLFVRIPLGVKPAALHPEVVNALFHLLGFVNFGQFFHIVLLRRTLRRIQLLLK